MKVVALDLSPFAEPVRNILALDGSGERRIPLVARAPAPAQAAKLIHSTPLDRLFPIARSPQGALAGLWLYFSAFEESHSVSQDLDTPEGSFWHGILHRQEPDAGNASYWFRRVGDHPVFPELHAAASALGYSAGVRWDPFAFINFCDKARRQPGTHAEDLAIRVQQAEWQLLFRYCALPVRP